MKHIKHIYIRSCFALTLLLYFAVQAKAQNTLSGIVTDKDTHEPLAGATIFIPDLKLGAITDSAGKYSVHRLPGGRFLVEVIYLSYGTFSQVVEVNGVTVFNAEMSKQVTELRGIVVTGVSAATEQRSNPVPVITIDRRQLQEQNATNAIDAVSRQPGIAQIATGPAISKPSIRGLGYNRVVTLFNGIRQEGQQWGDEHGIEIDEYSIERAEIIKGPGSIMYGSDALAGVINFITASPVPEGKIIGDVVTNYQTNNKLMGYSAMNAGSMKGFSWQMRLSQKQAGNYQNRYDGTVYNSGFKETNYNGYIGINRKWGYSHLHITSFNQTIAMTEGERDSSGNFTKPVSEDSATITTAADLKGYHIGVPYQHVRHNRVFLNNQFFIGRSRLTASVGYQLSRRQEFGDPTQPDVYSLYFYMPTLTWDVKFFFPDHGKWKSSAGVGGMWQSSENRGFEKLVPNYNLSDAGLFFFTQRRFSNRFHLSGGLRYDVRGIVEDVGMLTVLPSINVLYHNYAASAGITYTVNTKTLLRFNVAHGFRAPNIAELASNGRHEGTYRYEYGNKNLEAETSLQADAGVEMNLEHVHLLFSIFSNSIQHYIYAVRLKSVSGGDSIVDPSEPVPTYQYGQNKAWLYGGELTLDIHPHPFDWLHFENSFSMVHAQNLGQPDSAKYLPFIPAPRLLSELRANIKKPAKYLRNAFVKVNAEVYLAQNRYLKENNTERATPAYLLMNASAGTDVVNAKGTKLFTLLFGVSNLSDVAYQNHLSRLKYAGENLATGRTGVYNMGRNFSIKLLVPLVLRKG